MKEVILTPERLLLDGHNILFAKSPVIYSGVDEQWIDVYFGYKKRLAFAEERAHLEGYDKVADDGVSYFFFHEEKGCYGEGSRQIPHSEILTQMPVLPRYTKFLGIDFKEKDLNLKLKSDIDSLGLAQLETIVLSSDYENPDGMRIGEGERSGPSGVIIAMTDDYAVNVRY